LRFSAAALAPATESHLRRRSSSGCKRCERPFESSAGVWASRSTRSMCTPKVRSQWWRHLNSVSSDVGRNDTKLWRSIGSARSLGPGAGSGSRFRRERGHIKWRFLLLNLDI
jgi:hypothetical protein